MQTCGEKRPELPVTHWITITESDFESKQVKHKHYAASHFWDISCTVTQISCFCKVFFTSPGSNAISLTVSSIDFQFQLSKSSTVYFSIASVLGRAVIWKSFSQFEPTRERLMKRPHAVSGSEYADVCSPCVKGVLSPALIFTMWRVLNWRACGQLNIHAILPTPTSNLQTAQLKANMCH